MSNMLPIELHGSQLVAFPSVARSAPEPEFTSLEWSIIRLSRAHALRTIREPGRLGRAWNWLIGQGNTSLASPRLEALRRMAVLSWHFGFTVPGEDVAEFLSAGFTPGQYEMMVSSIAAATSKPRRIPA